MVDDRFLKTARSVATLAETREEREAAHRALHLADHELDVAFATRLRVVASDAPPAHGPMKALSERIAQSKTRVAALQKKIEKLQKDAATSDTAEDELALAQAQLTLEQDNLTDAQQDLIRHGGDRRARLKQALAEHEALQRETVQLPHLNEPVMPASFYGVLDEYFSWHGRAQRLRDAQQQAARHAAALEQEHDALEKLANGQAAPPTSATVDMDDPEQIAGAVAQMHRLSDQRKTLTDLDSRIQDTQQLAAAYQGWESLLESRAHADLHRLLVLTCWVLFIAFAVVMVNMILGRAFAGQKDRRRMLQLRAISRVAARVTGLLLIALILFGPPTQASTMIGLATAGLTVVLKDFIVAFFGWFVLMGKNGIRVGDFVEIKGVGGEVIEAGLLRTVLLEMGNWTDTGHPTGRRVAFVNSFAIDGHYFNFSTSGQWLWDELQISLPGGGDPYATAQQIRETVERETEQDALLAEQDWERVTHQYGTRTFSARPAVDLRPAGNGGLNVLIRYITRAPHRYDVKSRLLQVIVDVLHRPATTPALN